MRKDQTRQDQMDQTAGWLLQMVEQVVALHAMAWKLQVTALQVTALQVTALQVTALQVMA